MNYADWFLLGLAAVTAAMLLFPLQSLSEIQKNFSSGSLFQCHGINDSDRTQQRTITFIVRRAGLLRVLYADKRACGGDRRGAH